MAKVFWKDHEIAKIGKEAVKIIQKGKDEGRRVNTSSAIIKAQEVLEKHRRRPHTSIYGATDKAKEDILKVGRRELYREKEEEQKRIDRENREAAEAERLRVQQEEQDRIASILELEKQKDPIKQLFAPVLEELADIFKEQLAAKLHLVMKQELDLIRLQLPNELKSIIEAAADPKKKKMKIVVVGWPEEFCREFQKSIDKNVELKPITNGHAGQHLQAAAKFADYIVFNTAGSGHGASHSNYDMVRNHPGLISIEGGSTVIKDKILSLIQNQ